MVFKPSSTIGRNTEKLVDVKQSKEFFFFFGCSRVFRGSGGKAATFICVKGKEAASAAQTRSGPGRGHVTPECRSDSSEITTEQHDGTQSP